MMRLKTVEENIDNFNAVTEDAIARFTKLKEACGPNHHIPNLEDELKKFSMESKLSGGQKNWCCHVNTLPFILNALNPFISKPFTPKLAFRSQPYLVFYSGLNARRF